MALSIIAIVGLHVALPAKYRVNPPWLAPLVLLILLAILIIGDPGRIDRQKPWLRITTGAMIALLTLANLFAAGRLVGAIITVNKVFASDALALLGTGAMIWITNVVTFALWYWDLDRGGAAARAHHPQAEPGVRIRGDAAHRVHVSRLDAEVRRLPVAIVLDRDRVQPHRRLGD